MIDRWFLRNPDRWTEFWAPDRLPRLSQILPFSAGDPVSAAIVAGGGIAAASMGNDGGGGVSGPQMTPEQREALKQILPPATDKALTRIARAGQAYPGEFVAPLSEFEEFGLGALDRYLGSELPTQSNLFGAAKGRLEDVLSGEYDPFESQYYQSLRQNVLRELEESKDRLGAQTSARDKYFGGGRIETEGELEEQALGSLAQQLGAMYERERAEAIPQAMKLMAFEESMPLQRMQAAFGYGSLPRTMEQAQLEAERQEWQRQLEDLNLPVQVATGLTTYQPSYLYQSPTPSSWPSVVGDIGSSLILSSALGGGGDYSGWLESAASQAGNWLATPAW